MSIIYYCTFYLNLSCAPLSLADGQKASSFILENLKDPKTAFSGEPNEAPLHRVFNVDIPLWEWYELPEQSYRRRRFAVAMNGFGQMQPPEILVNGTSDIHPQLGFHVVDLIL